MFSDTHAHLDGFAVDGTLAAIVAGTPAGR